MSDMYLIISVVYYSHKLLVIL